jgi:hypothetical protein
MDPRDRAEAALARARARGAFVVTPDDAVSPMDAASTLQIPRAVVNALDTENPDSTMVIPASTASGQQPTQPLRDGQQPTQPLRSGQQQPMRNGQHPQQLPPAQTKPLSQYTQPVGPGHGHPGEPPAARHPGTGEEEHPQPRELGGLVPTVQQPGTQRSMLSRRLDGQ